MNVIINNSSMQPIYEQIVSQIKSLIMKGALHEEELLPSVRSLSRDLKISALTVKKAYDCLEQEGFIVTVHGKGSFVAPVNRNLVLEEQRKQVEADLDRAIRKGRSCGMSDQDIRDFDQIVQHRILKSVDDKIIFWQFIQKFCNLIVGCYQQYVFLPQSLFPL